MKRNAEDAAAKAVSEAKKQLDVNFVEGTSIAKEAFKLNREATTTAAAQALQAGVESERGTGATAGRVVTASNIEQAQNRASMEGALRDREMAIAEEDARLSGLKAEVSLSEAEGAQQAAADAAMLSAQAAEQGIQGFTTAANTLATDFLPLYGQNKANQFTGAKAVDLTTAQEKEFNALGTAKYKSATNHMMSQKKFNKYKKSLTPEQWNMFTSNQAYLDAQPTQ